MRKCTRQVVATLACLAVAACSRTPDTMAPLPRAADRPVLTPQPVRANELPRFVELVKEQGPAVVGISALRVSEPGGVPPGHPLY